MGVTLRLLALVLLLLAVLGCGRMSDQTVRDKDELRIETSKSMPGNNVPMDPADGR